MSLKKNMSSKSIIPYLFITPSLLILLVFSVIPIFQSAWLAQLDYFLVDASKSRYVGLQNFFDMFKDELVWISLWNTAYYSVGTVIPGLLISLMFALIITEPWFKLQNVARIVLFIPVIISMTIVGLMWSWLYSPSFGLFNYIFELFGLPQQQFLGDPNLAMPCIITMVIWKGFGYNVTIWSAGILSIAKEYREAARMDGANWFQEIRHIRLPLLKPVSKFLTVLGFIGSFQSFDAVYVTTSGGPMHKTSMYVFYLWQAAFRDIKLGYASAMSWLLFLILISLTYIQFKSYGKEEAI